MFSGAHKNTLISTMAVLLLTACPHHDPMPAPTLALSSDPLKSILERHPDPGLVAAAATLEQRLSQDELAYLDEVDWNRLRAEDFVSDVTIHKALQTLGENYSGVSVIASGLQVEADNVAADQSMTCEEAKSTAKRNLAIAVGEIVVGGALAYFSCSSVGPSLGTTSKVCVVAFIFTVVGVANLVGGSPADWVNQAVCAAECRADRAAAAKVCASLGRAFDGCSGCVAVDAGVDAQSDGGVDSGVDAGACSRYSEDLANYNKTLFPFCFGNNHSGSVPGSCVQLTAIFDGLTAGPRSLGSFSNWCPFAAVKPGTPPPDPTQTSIQYVAPLCGHRTLSLTVSVPADCVAQWPVQISGAPGMATFSAPETQTFEIEYGFR